MLMAYVLTYAATIVIIIYVFRAGTLTAHRATGRIKREIMNLVNKRE